MKPAIAALGRFVLTVSAVVGLASYANSEYYRRDVELAAEVCSATALECSKQQREAAVTSLGTWRRQQSILTLGLVGISGLSLWVAAEALLFQTRRLRVTEQRLRLSRQDLDRASQLKQSLQQRLQHLQQQFQTGNTEVLRQLEFSHHEMRQAAFRQLEAQLRSEIITLNRQIKASRQTRLQLERDLETVQQASDAAAMRTHDLEQQLQDAQMRVSNARSIEAQALEENDTLDVANRALTQEVIDLKNQLAIANSRPSYLSQTRSTGDRLEAIMLDATEKDFYPDEKRDILLDLLKAAPVEENTRRDHILQNILACNPPSGKGSQIERRLQTVLRDYRQMSPRVAREFAKLGFSLSQDGKHYKAIFKDDSRYTITFSKTGSDWRGGRNLIRDIRRRCL